MINIPVRDEKGVRRPQPVPTEQEYQSLLAIVEQLSKRIDNLEKQNQGKNTKQ